MRLFEFGGRGEAPSAFQDLWNHEAEFAESRDDTSRLAELMFPELAEWRPVLARLSVPIQAAVRIAVQARAEGADLQSGLLASGIGESDLIHAIAGDLGIGVAEVIDADRLVVSERHSIALLRGRGGQVPVRLVERDGRISFLITPARMKLGTMRMWIRTHPALAARLKLADPETLRGAMLKRARPSLARTASGRLFERFPDLSARIVANAWQGAVAGILLTALPMGLMLAWDDVMIALHIFASFFFFVCVGIRFLAAASAAAARRQPGIGLPKGDPPVYSVLVALYREAEIVPDLLASLDRLVWPRGRLEIKLVCEADDDATLAAIRANALPQHIEVIEVPPGNPRTKPKALDYALPLVGGEFIALFDAEDTPHPQQLVEAWQRFRDGGPDLAAVQAPLEITNADDGILARMFAFEYAGLFRGLLPWLSSRRLLLPLGGTSNHFRRAALEDVCGWDPFNVTEDVDLAVRFARFGYRTTVIRLPTFEPAPNRFRVWLPQRTRWFKGWAQTWLVHMRDPMALARELGPGSFLVAQVLFAGMLASAILHPVLLATLIFLSVQMLLRQEPDAFGSTLMLIDVVNVVCGYLSFLILGWQTLAAGERAGFWKVVLFTPVYWMMLSLAGWLALWELWRRPHHWDKTPHDKTGSAVGHALASGTTASRDTTGPRRRF